MVATDNVSRRDWTNTLVLAGVHLGGVLAIAYLVFVRSSPWTLLLAAFWYFAAGVAVTGGYHRLFAHRSYRASAGLRTFYLLFGAAAVQNSALKWASDHRVHHAHTDQPEDPYAIQKGFWWAHVGWVLTRPARPRSQEATDLSADPLVRWQHRAYVPLAVLMTLVVPAALGALWGDALGALLVAGLLRLVVQWHTTFSINSLAHMIGSRPYSRAVSARDNVWLALVSFGEGYHNFHHRFQADYRNGPRWFHFDPTKWLIASLAAFGLARDLHRTPSEAIHRARAVVRAELYDGAPDTRQAALVPEDAVPDARRVVLVSEAEMQNAAAGAAQRPPRHEDRAAGSA